jgi:hypothetical protein
LAPSLWVKLAAHGKKLVGSPSRNRWSHSSHEITILPPLIGLYSLYAIINFSGESVLWEEPFSVDPLDSVAISPYDGIHDVLLINDVMRRLVKCGFLVLLLLSRAPTGF